MSIVVEQQLESNSRTSIAKRLGVPLNILWAWIKRDKILATYDSSSLKQKHQFANIQQELLEMSSAGLDKSGCHHRSYLYVNSVHYT